VRATIIAFEARCSENRLSSEFIFLVSASSARDWRNTSWLPSFSMELLLAAIFLPKA
jgi:hypothetical protein